MPIGRMAPPTLQGIADALGVHVSTVSRVLNPRPGDPARAASTETAERIRAHAAEIGYRVNPHARSLRTRRSDTVGVLFPRLGDLAVASIWEGIESAAAERGVGVLVAGSQDDPATQESRIALARTRRADGLILGDAHLDARVPDRLGEEGYPFVLVARRAGSHPAVTCDDRVGGRLAAAHLLAAGHRELAVIAGPGHASTAVDRTAGFLARCEQDGVGVPPERVVPSGFDVPSGRAAAERLLDLPTRPTAVFAVDDALAIGAMGAIRDRGLVVGADIALAGFDDTPLAAQLPIPLTSVRSPAHEMGRRSLDLLLRRLAGEAVGSERLAPELVVRASTRR